VPLRATGRVIQTCSSSARRSGFPKQTLQTTPYASTEIWEDPDVSRSMLVVRNICKLLTIYKIISHLTRQFHEAVSHSVAQVGVDRIMFSTDYPYASMAKGRAFLDQLPVSDADRERIASGNAEHLLGL